MKLTNGERTVEVKNPVQIKAFKKNGWVEPAEEKSTTKKA